MRRLVVIVVLALFATACTPAQQRAWLVWHRADPEAATAFLETGPGRALATAERVTPPSTGPTSCAELASYRQAAGLPSRFDALAYRESRCTADPSVRTSCCVGPLQLYVRLFLRDHRMADRIAACGVTSESDVDGPQPWELRAHYCVAAALFDVEGFSPWS